MPKTDEPKPHIPGEQVEVSRSDDGHGAVVSFRYDAALIERFRERFPRARWSENTGAWFVPGSTADRRVEVWLQGELSKQLAFADERGRDAFAFDPIESEYLEAGRDLVVRTPFSRTIIEQLRRIPWASWDSEERVWRVPFRSFEALRAGWLSIENAARRAEPSERKRRREELKRSPDFAEIKRLEAERRRKRLPFASSQLPPFGRPMTTNKGVVVVTGSDGELADAEAIATAYPGTRSTGDHVWVFWRWPTLEELVRIWPARQSPDSGDLQRGWWQPTLDDLRAARRKARSIKRAAATKVARANTPPGETEAAIPAGSRQEERKPSTSKIVPG